MDAVATYPFPPKYDLKVQAQKPQLIKIIYSIVLYIGLGYLLLRRWDLLFAIMGVVLLHELGHFSAMKYYKYADVGIFFIPVLGAFVSGSKKQISQRQNAVILMAGPLPGIICGILLHFITAKNEIFWGDIPLSFIAQLLVWVNVINLLPLYPLDGGQLLNRIFLQEEGWLSNLFIFSSIVIMCAIAISTKFYILLILPLLLIIKYFSGRNYEHIEKKLADAQLDIDKEYDELSNKNYWDIRSILVTNLPALQGVSPGPPYIYHIKEEKIAHEVNNVLQRNLLLDISLAGKILLIIIWVPALAAPWIFDVDFLLLQYFRH